ncbi:MAG: hypothetical protein WKG07_28755 [Hymenobacter sp.]
MADQTGTLLDPDALTIVWARRFAAYKRADLILRDFERFVKLVSNDARPVQVIWAGKPYPKDYGAIDIFNSHHSQDPEPQTLRRAHGLRAGAERRR